MLSRLGWQVCYLGANTPTPEIAYTARTLRPRAVVLSAHRRTAFAAHGPALRRLGKVTEVHIAGPGATDELAALCEAQARPRQPRRRGAGTARVGRAVRCPRAGACQASRDEVG